jgi:hypothetical protein
MTVERAGQAIAGAFPTLTGKSRARAFGQSWNVAPDALGVRVDETATAHEAIGWGAAAHPAPRRRSST